MENIANIMAGASEYTQNEYTSETHVAITDVTKLHSKFLVLKCRKNIYSIPLARQKSKNENK